MLPSEAVDSRGRPLRRVRHAVGLRDRKRNPRNPAQPSPVGNVPRPATAPPPLTSPGSASACFARVHARPVRREWRRIPKALDIKGPRRSSRCWEPSPDLGCCAGAGKGLSSASFSWVSGHLPNRPPTQFLSVAALRGRLATCERVRRPHHPLGGEKESRPIMDCADHGS